MGIKEDAIESVLEANRNDIEAIKDVSQRKLLIDDIINNIDSSPALNFQAEPSEQTLVDLDKFQRAKESQDYNDPALKNVIDSNIKKNSRLSELQSQGVITDRELPAGSLESGFGDNDLRSFKGALSDYFKTDVAVFKSGGDKFYIDPVEKRPVKVNAGAAGMIGKSIPFITELAAAFIAPNKKDSIKALVAKEGAYAGILAAQGEYIKLSIGQALGAHDMDQKEIIKESGVAGAWTAAMTLGIGAMISSTKGIYNISQGRPFTTKDATAVGVKAEDADEMVAEVNKLLPQGEGFNPTLGQKTDDVLIQSSEAKLRGNEAYAPDLIARDAQNIQSEQAALKVVGKQEVKPFAPETVGDVAESKVNKMVAREEAPIIASEKELKSQLDDIGKVKKGLVGDDTLAVIKEKDEVAKDAYKAQYTRIEKEYGYNKETELYGIEIPRGEGAKRLESILSRQSESSTTTTGSSSTAGIFTSSEKSRGKIAQRKNVVNRQIVSRPSKREGKLQDLGDYKREISRLKSDKRRVSNNPQKGDLEITDIDKVIKSLEGDRRLALIKAGKEELSIKIDAADLATSNYYKVYKRSVIGDLTELNKNGISKIKTKDFVDNMIKRDTKEVDNFIEVIGDNPELMLKWKEGLGDAYYRKGFPDGKFNSRMSAEWLEENKVILNKFGYTDAQIKGFKRTGEFQKKIIDDRKKFDSFVTKANTKWGAGKLKSIDPRNLVKFVTNETGSWITPKGQGVQSSIAKIKSVKMMVKGNPGAWQAFQNDFKQSLKNDLTDLKSGGISHSKLLEWTNAKNKDTVIEVMGKNYYDDLIKIEKVVGMLKKKMKPLSVDEGRRGWIQSFRGAVAPPLTKKGRFFTAMLIFSGKKAHDSTIKALLDQKTLREVAKLAEHDTVTRRVMEKAYSLGLGLPDE